ncbi:MAG: DUF465 domain-containing protein [Pyrinomonadaceae bacterium]
MEISKAEALKNHLMATDSLYRELAREHSRYENRLTELSALPYPSAEEQFEESTLKKKKLALKDRMQEMLAHYRQVTETTSHQGM